MPLSTPTPLRLSLPGLAIAALGLTLAATSANALTSTNGGQAHHHTHKGAYTRVAYRQEAAYRQDAAYQPQAGDDIVIIPQRVDRGPRRISEMPRMTASRLVSYRDLDIDSRGGARALHGRIVRAAQDNCGDLETLYPSGDPEVADCVSDAVRDAEHSVPRNDAYRGR